MLSSTVLFKRSDACQEILNTEILSHICLVKASIWQKLWQIPFPFYLVLPRRGTQRQKLPCLCGRKGTSKPSAHKGGEYRLGELGLEWCIGLCIRVPKKGVSWQSYATLSCHRDFTACWKEQNSNLVGNFPGMGRSCPCLLQWSYGGWAVRSRSNANGAHCSPDFRGAVTTLAGWSSLWEILEKQANCRVEACLANCELIKSPAWVGRC